MSYDPKIYKAISSIPASSPNIDPVSSTVPFWDVPPPGNNPVGALDPSPSNFSPWDTIFFGGQQFPGLARVRSKKCRQFDVKKTRSKSGATFTSTGYKPAEIDVTLSIWTADQLSQLQNLIPMLLSAPGAPTNKLSAVDVYHPSLALIQVTKLVVFDVDALEPGTPKGVWTMKIHCREWYPQPKTDQNKTVNGAATFHANAALKSGTTSQAAAVPKPSVTSVGTTDPDLLPPIPVH